MMTSGSHLTCEEVNGFLATYLEDALPRNVLEEFEWHLERCESCRNYLHSYRETIRIARMVCSSPALPAEDLPEALIEAILRSTGRK